MRYEIELEQIGKPNSLVTVFDVNGNRRTARFASKTAAIEAARIIYELRTDNVLVRCHVVTVLNNRPSEQETSGNSLD
jgi:hypothetical protein